MTKLNIQDQSSRTKVIHHNARQLSNINQTNNIQFMFSFLVLVTFFYNFLSTKGNCIDCENCFDTLFYKFFYYFGFDCPILKMLCDMLRIFSCCYFYDHRDEFTICKIKHGVQILFSAVNALLCASYFCKKIM